MTAPIPNPDAPRLVAKARAGKPYDVEIPALSSLDRYTNLVRAIDSIAEAGRFETMVTAIGELARKDAIKTNQLIRAVGAGFKPVLDAGEGVLRTYVDSTRPFAEQQRDLNYVRRDAKALHAQRPGDDLGIETRKAAAFILTAMRNAVMHAKAMTGTIGSEPFAPGCALLDPIISQAWQQLSRSTEEEFERAVVHFSSGNGPSRPQWRR